MPRAQVTPRRLLTLAAAAAALASAGPAGAATFYVSSHGHDRANGRSPAQPWRTIRRVNAARLAPGDTVRFEGGDTFTDSTLMPPASGARGKAITFTSYGTGRATISHSRVAVWFAGRRHLLFAGLTLTTGGTDGAVISGSPSAGSTSIGIRGCVIRDTAGVGIYLPTAADAGWRIVGNTVSHTGDSAIIVGGSGATVSGNTISDVGWNSGISWDKHGVYVKGRRAIVRGNHITQFQADGISLRYDDAIVDGNVVDGGQFGIAFFDYTRRIGTSYLRSNRISGVREGFYFSPEANHVTGGPPQENFVVSHNVIQSSGPGVDLTGGRYSRLTFSYNDVRSGSGVGIAARAPAGGSYVEHHNAFHTSVLFDWNGNSLTYALYRVTSGQGRGDTF